MKIAVEGCAHGELDKIYETLLAIERDNNIKIDLLLCCGDFQSVRNKSDLSCMAVPQKYQSMCTFYKYYSGEKTAPILTVFIGGNHEASNYLGELAYGGWVCPNIYYLGYASVIKFAQIRIAGISGIFKGHDFLRGHFEKPPYDNDSKRSAYHIRNIDIFRLKQISQPVNVFISHDWPRGIYHHGDLNALLRRKPFLRDDVSKERLGSAPTWDLLELLRPEFWFAAHLHVKFSAMVTHYQNDDDKCAASSPKVTKFLALDKCLPRRDFLQVLDIGPEDCDVDVADKTLSYDEEWLCILRSTNHLLSVSKNYQYLPNSKSNERWNFRPTEEELSEVRQLFKNDFRIPQNFQPTAEVYDPAFERRDNRQPKVQINPQTTDLCRKLGISDPFQILLDQMCQSTASLTINSFSSNVNTSTSSFSANKSFNPDEVVLDDEDDDDDDDKFEESANDSRFSDMPSTDMSGILDDSTSAASTSNSLNLTPRPLVTPRSKLILPPASTTTLTTRDPLPPMILLDKPSACSTPTTHQTTGISSTSGIGDVADRIASPPSETVEDGSAVQESPVKKFKRRNLAIYAAAAAEAEDDDREQ